MIALVGLAVGLIAGYLTPVTVIAGVIPADWVLIARFGAPIVGGLIGLRLGMLLEGR